MAIKEKQKRKKIVLALQGGGALGALTWGVLEALLKDGRFDIQGISGTSAGAMNALALASGFANRQEAGAIESLRKLWFQLSLLENPFYRMYKSKLMINEGIISEIDAWLSSILIYSTSHISPYVLNPLNYNLLENIIEGCFDIPAIQASQFPKLFLTATHIKSGKIKVFQNSEISRDSILATICLPMFSHAACVNKEFYWDGGLVANPAIFPLIYGCKDTKDILIIPLTKLGTRTIPKQVHEIKARYNEIILNSCLMREMRIINFITQLIDERKLVGSDIHRYNLHIINNDDLYDTLNYSNSFKIEWNFLTSLYEKGLEIGEKWIENNFDSLGTDLPFNPSIYEDYVMLY